MQSDFWDKAKKAV
jgi:hypothetical protein